MSPTTSLTLLSIVVLSISRNEVSCVESMTAEVICTHDLRVGEASQELTLRVGEDTAEVAREFQTRHGVAESDFETLHQMLFECLSEEQMITAIEKWTGLGDQLATDGDFAKALPYFQYVHKFGGELTSEQLAHECSYKGLFRDGTCFCDSNTYGLNCTTPITSFYIGAKNWNHFESEAFKSRYVLAAASLQQCRHVLEIGGYKTPISMFLHDPEQSVTVVDPFVASMRRTVPRRDGGVAVRRHLRHLLQEYRSVGDEDCFLWVGLECSEFPLQTLIDLLRRFPRLVIEYAHWEPSIKCYQDIVATGLFRPTLTVHLDLSEPGNDLKTDWNSWPPVLKRTLAVLERT